MCPLVVSWTKYVAQGKIKTFILSKSLNFWIGDPNSVYPWVLTRYGHENEIDLVVDGFVWNPDLRNFRQIDSWRNYFTKNNVGKKIFREIDKLSNDSHHQDFKVLLLLWRKKYSRCVRVQKWKKLLAPKKNSSNQLLSNFFSKTVTHTNFLPKKCESTVWKVRKFSLTHF